MEVEFKEGSPVRFLGGVDRIMHYVERVEAVKVHDA